MAKINAINENVDENGFVQVEFYIPRTIDSELGEMLQEKASDEFMDILKTNSLSIRQDIEKKRIGESERLKLEQKKQALEEEKKSIDKKAFKL